MHPLAKLLEADVRPTCVPLADREDGGRYGVMTARECSNHGARLGVPAS